MVFAALAGFAIAATAVTVQQDELRAGLLKPDDRRVLALGKTLYADSCASCHGVELEGQVEDWRSPGPDGLMPAPPHDETGHTWHHTDQIFFEITKYGIVAAANLKNYTSAMPVYEGVLTDAEIIAVLSYIKSTWPDKFRSGDDKMITRYFLEPK
ncbi:cytochrome c [Hoeflea sp. AS60]|uniref:c-type cytochrome n=1 Tax=Hoeflea sp. AS60 TaxID=3135780 RepID=UPI00316B74B8